MLCQCAIRWLHALGHLPMSWLYALSTLMRPIVQHVVGYRREVVRRNLLTSFPAESSDWRAEVERNFYAFLCDYAVETLRFAVAGEEEVKQRMQFVGVEALKKDTSEAKTAIFFLGHYGNWEWISSLPLWLQGSAHCGQLYKHIHSETINRFFLQARGRFGSENINKNDALRRIVQLRKEETPSIIGFIADQCPRSENIHHWLSFLHQDTPVFTGAERIAKKAQAVAYFGHISRPRRGEYVCTLHPLASQEEVAQLPEYALTERYMQALEQMIKDTPHLWLWSHKRWKQQRTPTKVAPYEA